MRSMIRDPSLEDGIGRLPSGYFEVRDTPC